MNAENVVRYGLMMNEAIVSINKLTVNEEEYDGSESLIFEEDLDWITA